MKIFLNTQILARAMAVRRGVCLASQDLRDKIVAGEILTNAATLARYENNRFADTALEDRIQPSSLDTTLGNEVFIIDAHHGLFRPTNDKQVYRFLIETPGSLRQRISIQNGFEIKRGATYLLPLVEKVRLRDNETVKSSPKSSYGRLFLNSRLLADYNDTFNQVHNGHDEEMMLWLLVQPRKFNAIIYPGLTLSQLRFFEGDDALLSDGEVREECKKSPLLYEKTPDGLVPVKPHILEGLHTRLDGKGTNTNGIVAFLAKDNPQPIDLQAKDMYEPERYFIPLLARENPKLLAGESYLVCTKEVLKTPAHLSAEEDRYHQMGFEGPLDDAGFIDNGFEGDLVGEVTPTESTAVPLRDGTPFSALRYYNTKRIPDKIYGNKIGSHYQGQVGPKTSKHFKKTDYAGIAHEFNKLNRIVLTQDAHKLQSLRTQQTGFESLSHDNLERLLAATQDPIWHFRYDCETDEQVLQPIPYVIFFNEEGHVFTYQRAQNIKDYGDKRLFSKYSIGVGGHIGKNDAPQFVMNCLTREAKEEVRVEGVQSAPVIVGTLMEYVKPVDRVHFGVIAAVHVKGAVLPKESSIRRGMMLSPALLQQDMQWHIKNGSEKYETWTNSLIPHLTQIYNASKSSAP